MSALVRLERELVKRQGLYGFIKLAWEHTGITDPYVDNWHIEEYANHLQAVSEGRIRNLIANIPPGTGKSVISGTLWPAWDWIDNPANAWINASYDMGLPTRDAIKLIRLIRSPWYVERWGIRLPPDEIRLAHSDFENVLGGYRFSTSVAGKGMGRHCDIQVVDDPTKPKDAMGGSTKALSRALASASEWWRHTMASRLKNPATSRRVIVMQRLHQSDLAGEMLATGDYIHLCLPMRYDETSPCRTPIGGDRRRRSGELLHPARWPEAEVRKLEREMGPSVAAAQLQQSPAVAGGTIFKTGTIQYYRQLPTYYDEAFQSWDFTFKDSDGSDFVAGGCWYMKDGDFYLAPDIVNDRLSFTASVAAVRTMTYNHPRAYVKLFEDKANGPAIENHLRDTVEGIELVNPNGGKVARANLATPILEARRVYFPHPDICPRILELTDTRKGQMFLFPRAAHDDLVDMLTQALLYGNQGGQKFLERWGRK